MGLSRLGVAALGFVIPAFLGLYACGSKQGAFDDGGVGGGSGSSSGSTNELDGGDDGSSSGSIVPLGDGGNLIGDALPPGTMISDSGVPVPKGSFTAPDCSGCKFPQMNAPACSGGPAIKIVYPIDGVLVPPNMNLLSVQWTPFGGYKTYEVDFSNPITDVRIVTKCSAQTQDTSQPSPVASGGCEYAVGAGLYKLLSAANAGGTAVSITVRGSSDGTCASTSANPVRLSFAEEDLLGDIYYWKSLVTSGGTGGQIWVKSFGDTTNPEVKITGTQDNPPGKVLAATCNGCHALSRDGLRMVVYSDDADSDDEYSDVSGSLIDMKAYMTLGTAAGGGGGFGAGRGGQPPGFSTMSPSHTNYLTSDGSNTSPTNSFGLWDGNAGMKITDVTFGNSSDRPTMPDWSPDGTNVVYTLPQAVASWGGSVGGTRNDDDHEFGGSIWILPYMGSQKFGTPTEFIKSAGENNYYPSYSPDGTFIVFDRAAHDGSVSTIDGCTTTPHPSCPNDSFSNPNARLMLTSTTAAMPIDLERANGSAAGSPLPLSNSWPRWSPFVQSYHGSKLLWVAFSSTRDYGVLVRNHLTGMYQCYPPDSAEQPGAPHGSQFDNACQQPKLWMAAINLSEGQGGDPSFPAFFLPYQDITTHNHTPQWTQEVITQMPPKPGCTALPVGSKCMTTADCCNTNVNIVCTGTQTCGQVVN